MTLTKPKKDSPISYVTSESKPNSTEATHIVVKVAGTYFCDCRDFMVRRLTKLSLLSANAWILDMPLCKHGEFVRDTEQKIPVGQKLVVATRTKKKFGIFFIGSSGEFRSIDYPATYSSSTAALDDITKNEKTHYNKYIVKEL